MVAARRADELPQGQWTRAHEMTAGGKTQLTALSFEMTVAGSPMKLEDFRTQASSAGFAIAESTFTDWRKKYLTNSNCFHDAVGHGASVVLTEDQESLLTGFVLHRRSLLHK